MPRQSIPEACHRKGDLREEQGNRGWAVLEETGDLAPAMRVHIYTSSKFKVSSLDTRKALPLDKEYDIE